MTADDPEDPAGHPAGRPVGARATRAAQHAAEHRRRRRAHIRRRRWVVGILVGVVTIAVVVLVISSTLFVKGATVSHDVFQGGGSVIDLVKTGAPLETDAHGRTNIVIFGTSQDDKGHLKQAGGGGLWLTDSIQILSVDQKTKDVSMVAVPRDLWVKLPLHNGKPCMVGYYSKINAVYECGSGLVGTTSATKSTYAAQDAAGAEDLMSVLGDVTGLTPQYWVHVDYTVVREAVDAVGGIDVHIVGDGANGIYDTNLDSDACNASGKVSCRHVYYPKNGTYHLSGQQALDLSRARGDANPYAYKNFGLNGGDFDRQANQQKVMVALKNAATSAGVLGNPVKIFNLMSALGNHVTTSLSTGEAKTLIQLAGDLPAGAMKGINLTDKKKPMLTTGWESGQSVVIPTAGAFAYGRLQHYIRARIEANAASGTTASGTTASGTTASGTTASGTTASSPSP